MQNFLTGDTAMIMEFVGLGCLVGGFAVFVRNVIRKDGEYERYLAWPVRFLLYSVSYVLVPPAGLAIGLYLVVYKASLESRKFGMASLFVSTVYLVIYSAVYFGPPSALIQYAP